MSVRRVVMSSHFDRDRHRIGLLAEVGFVERHRHRWKNREIDRRRIRTQIRSFKFYGQATRFLPKHCSTICQT